MRVGVPVTEACPLATPVTGSERPARPRTTDCPVLCPATCTRRAGDPRTLAAPVLRPTTGVAPAVVEPVANDWPALRPATAIRLVTRAWAVPCPVLCPLACTLARGVSTTEATPRA